MDFETHPVPAHMISTGSEHLGPQFAGGKPVGPSASSVGSGAVNHSAKDITSTGKHSGNIAKPTSYAGSRRAPQTISSQDRGKHAAGYSPGKDIASIHNEGKTSYEGKHRQVTPETKMAKAGKIAKTAGKAAGKAAVKKLRSGSLTSKHGGGLAGSLNKVSGR